MRRSVEIIEALRKAREVLPQEAAATRQQVAKLVDWRQYVAAHPWLAVGLAAGAGYLVVSRIVNASHVSHSPPVEPTNGIHLPAAAQANGAHVPEPPSLGATVVSTVLAVAARSLVPMILNKVLEQAGSRLSGTRVHYQRSRK